MSGVLVVTVHRASPVTTNEDPATLTLTAVDAPPEFTELADARAFYRTEGVRVARALIDTLPQGTVDQVLVELLEHRASLFRVFASDPRAGVDLAHQVLDYIGAEPHPGLAVAELLDTDARLRATATAIIDRAEGRV